MQSSQNQKQQIENRQKPHEMSIYDGLLTKTVYFAQIKSSKIFNPSQIYLQTNNDSKMNALKYRFPLKYLGTKYADVVVPCTPAYELSLNLGINEQQNNQYKDLCFAKVSNNTGISAIASGKRSAIFVDKNNKLLRFKGCGNQFKGFNRQNNESRGHHFYHTAKRQMYITKHINEILQKRLGISPPANKPLYSFDYPSQQIFNANLSNDLPQISKYCCVFQTQGDRRAGTHLISPLQILYLNLVDHQNANWELILKQKNRIQNNELVELVAHFQLFLDSNSKFLNVYDASTQISNYINFPNESLSVITDYHKKIEQITNKLVPQPYQQKVIELFSKIEGKQIIKTIQIILKKIGYQMGQIKRVMCQNQISWGFYLDHGVQWHCNAHLNNFVVTKPQPSTVSSNYFMLPLDYDLAYSSKQFICIDLDSEHYGKFSDQIFQNYLCGQFTAMEMSLFGLELMNFKYGIQDYQNNQNKKMGRLAFRDTLVQAFNFGMKNKDEERTKILNQWNQNIQKIQLLVQACLYLSIDFQT